MGDGGGQANQVVLADEAGATPAPPALVNNVETMANVAPVLVDGPDAFRSTGTPGSPGTMVFTITGDTVRHGVAELPLGTPLGEVIERIGGGVGADRQVRAVLPGVSSPVLTDVHLDVPACFEALSDAGSGLGSGGFLVYDDATDPVAVALGVARFLSVESCGQCTPCKQDGLAVAAALDVLAGRPGGDEAAEALAEVRMGLSTVATGARCALGRQERDVLGSLLAAFPEAFERRAVAGAELDPVPPVLVAPLVDLVDGRAVPDERQAAKQPDWSFDEHPSDQVPVERFGHEAEVHIG